MTWLLWRQHRSRVYFALGALAVLVVVLAVTGVHMANSYHAALRSCVATNTCDSVGDGLFSGDGAIIDIVNLTAIVPALIGLFWGAPLLAREIEEGTHKLVWTQSVTRRHWLAGKTIALLGATTVVAAIVALSVTWWSRTFDLIDHDRFTGGHFDVQGIVPIAYALFAASLGLAAGALLRRTLPALAVTIGVFVTLRIAVATYLRPHFEHAVVKLLPLTAADNGIGGSSWILHSNMVQPNGRALPSGNLLGVIPAACHPGDKPGKANIFSCLAAHGFRQRVVYQPASRFWTFQSIEAGLFLVLAVALIATAFALVSRDA